MRIRYLCGHGRVGNRARAGFGVAAPGGESGCSVGAVLWEASVCRGVVDVGAGEM